MLCSGTTSRTITSKPTKHYSHSPRVLSHFSGMIYMEHFYLLSFYSNLFPNSFSSESGQWSCLSLSESIDELFHQENKKAPTIGPAKWIRKSLKIYMFKYIRTITAKEWLSDQRCQPHREWGMGLVGCLAYVIISFVLLPTLRCLKRNIHDISIYTWMPGKLGFS